MTAPVDKIPDAHAKLRARLAERVASGGSSELARLAGLSGLSEDTLTAFRAGAHLAEWASERLARALDHDAAKRGDRDASS